MTLRPCARKLFLGTFAVALGAAHGRAQGGTQPAPVQALQEVAQRQQKALESGDAGQILPASRHLAAIALQLAGALYAAEEQPGRAGEAYGRSLLVEESPEARVQLITSDVQAGKPEQTGRDEAAMLQALGDTMQTRMLIANAHHAAEDLNGTIAQLGEVIRLEPGSAAAHLALGNAFWELNQFGYNAESLREFTEAQRLDPPSYLPNYDLGAVLSQYQRYREAGPYLEGAAKADAASPDPWMLLGMNAFAQGRMAEADAALGKAVALTGADVAHGGYQVMRAYAALSRIETGAGRGSVAEVYDRRADAVRAEMLRNNVAPALSQSTGLVANTAARGAATPAGLQNGRAAGGTASTAQQQEIERQLLQIAAKSLNDAGTALARNRDYEGALPLFRMAAETDAELVPVMRNYGLAAFHMRHYAEAVTALTRAVQMDAGDATASRYLEQARSLAGSGPGPSTSGGTAAPQ